MKLGDRIRLKRKELGLTQTDLAKMVGFQTKGAISRVENGTRDLTQTQIIDFSKALGCSPSYLMGWVDDESYETVIHKDKDFKVLSSTRKIAPSYKPVFGNQLLAMTEPTKEAKGAQEQEVEYYPGTDEPTREYMLDFIDREYPTAAFSGGDIHTMNYEELREYYEAVLEEIREEDGK